MGFSPITKVWHPPPLILWNHALFIQRCTAAAGCGFILIDVCIYMMPNYNVPNSTRSHRQLPLLPKHTQPNRWWDFFLLELLTTINYNIYIMQTGSKPGTLHLQENMIPQLSMLLTDLLL